MPTPLPGLLPFFRGFNPLPRSVPAFHTLQVSERGMSAHLARMEVAASNIANAETTRVAGEGSGPYRRRVVQTEEITAPVRPVVPPLPPLPGESAPQPTMPDPTLSLGGVRVTGIAEDPTPGPLVYDPGHPDADAQGYVRYPNVRVTDEITDFMDARRQYEANASVFQAAKALLRRSLDI